MRQFPENQAQAGNSSANTDSVQVSGQPNLGAIDMIQVLNGASPFILLIVLAYVGKQFVDSVCRLVETIKEK